MVKWYYKTTEREVPHILVPRRGCLVYSKVYCDVRKRWFMTWNQSIYITYYIFIILIPKSVLVFFTFLPHFVWWRRLNHCVALVRNLPTSILVCASVSLLTFHTHRLIVLATLWFTNFESLRFLPFFTSVPWGILPITNLVDCADNCHTSLIFSFFPFFYFSSPWN